MIFWTRWGIIGFLFIGVGVGIGFLLHNLSGFGHLQDSATTGMFIGIGLLISAVLLWFFERGVIRPKWDRPRPIMVSQKLDEPFTDAEGRVQTHRFFPAVHPDTGHPIMQVPRSTLFFIPLRFWPYVIASIGAAALISNLIKGFSA